MNHGVILLFTLRGCRGIIFLMDETAACVTVVGIRAPADTHTPFVSNQVIDKTRLQLCAVLITKSWNLGGRLKRQTCLRFRDSICVASDFL